jgi:hypothetical protein
VRDGLPGDAAAVLAPLFRPGTSVLPDCLTPTVLVGDQPVDEHLDLELADRRLVRARLLERHRLGKQVHIRRTPRGDALLDLLA